MQRTPARRVDRLVLLDLEPSQRGPDPLMHMGGKPADPYDPSRHPLLGYYYGDDPVVLDWQSYWLYEHGSTPCACWGMWDGWEDPNHGNHWMYQLFHNAPNFRNLRYVIAGPVP